MYLKKENNSFHEIFPFSLIFTFNGGGGLGAHLALELNYVPLQGIYQVFKLGYPNIVLHGKMSQRMTNKHL